MRTLGARRTCAVLGAAVIAALVVAVAPATALTPPDGRAYELVSPVDKLGSLPNFPGGNVALGFAGLGALTAASLDGDHMFWTSTGAFANATSAVPMSYESSRTPQGWETVQASPDPHDAIPTVLTANSVIRDATDDFAKRVIMSDQQYDPLIQGPFGSFFKQNVYVQDANGTLTWVSRPNSGPSTEMTDATYEGRDATASHILFGTLEALVPQAAGLSGVQLYDHSGGVTTMVNVDNAGNPVSTCGAVLGAQLSFSATPGRVTTSAVSSDGSRIVFTTPDPSGMFSSGDPACTDPTKVYVRTNGATTVLASASQRTTADPLGTQPATFEGAIDQGGDKVYFISAEALTNDAADGNADVGLLYAYDVPTGQLSLLTPNTSTQPKVKAVLGFAKDGSRLYVVAHGQLSPDAPNDAAAKIFAYSSASGQFTYIGEVPDDLDAFLDSDQVRPVRVTPDGNRLLFSSKDNLRGFDTGGHEQLYLYDAPSDTLTCVSCPQSGLPTGDAFLFEDVDVAFHNNLPRNMTDDGRRIFFETTDALVPQDDNGVMDVYEWEDPSGNLADGTVHLISGGHGKDPSFFADSANDGADVFFVTTDQLIPQDTNVDLDVYDARIGGGFAPPNGVSRMCIDDQCQGQPSPPPVLPTAVSQGDFGNGNAVLAGRVRLLVGRITAGARRALARTGRLTLLLDVNHRGTAHATATARLHGRARVVGRGRRSVSKGGLFHLRLTLSRAARRQLAHAGKLRLRITVSFTGASPRKTTITLVAPKRATR